MVLFKPVFIFAPVICSSVSTLTKHLIKNLLLKHAHFFAHADIKKSVVTAFFKFVKELAKLFRLDV